MTTYYTSVAGNDADNGLGPDASHATNRPWRTWQKALGAAGIASGDTVYLGPGVYREMVTIGVSPVAETSVLGDPANVQGFKNGAGVLLAAGEVRLTNYLTDDKTAPTDAGLVDFNGKDFLTFKNITFNYGGSGGANPLYAATTISTNIKFYDCLFSFFQSNSVSLFSIVASIDTALHWLFSRCRSISWGGAFVNIQANQAHTADLDLDVVFENCLAFATQDTIIVRGNGMPGGVVFRNGAIITPGYIMNTSSTSQITPCQVKNSFCVSLDGWGIYAYANAAEISDNYNIIVSDAGASGIEGPNTKVNMSYNPLFHLGQELIWGDNLRHFFTPTPDSPMLAFGDDGTAPAVDLLNEARPAVKSVGPLERHSVAASVTLREALFKGMHKR